MKKTKNAFSLILAMFLVIVMSSIAYFLLSYIVPFSQNTKGIENSVNAYYQAESSIEQALYFVNKIRTDYSSESGSVMSISSVGNNFSMSSSGTTLPKLGDGNSEFDKNYDIIRTGDPIQLDIGNLRITNLGNFKFSFQVPDLSSLTETLSGGTLPIINWQLNSETDSLNATGSFITANNITNKDIISLGTKDGIKLDGNTETFSSFYSANCGAGKSCSLKLSVINKLELSTNKTPVPYIEWKLEAGSSIPLRYTVINSSGKSYGFKKDLQVRIPQQTVNEAFDFTVFQ